MTKRTKCRDVILDHLKSRPNEWVSKISLFVICYERGHSPESCGRRLRELENEEILKVGYYDGRYSRNLAKYSLGEVSTKKVIWQEVVQDDGTRVMQQI